MGREFDGCNVADRDLQISVRILLLRHNELRTIEGCAVREGGFRNLERRAMASENIKGA